jgi:hypothetical protein
MTQPEVEYDPVVPAELETDYHAEESDYDAFFDHDHSALDVDFFWEDGA